MGSRPATGGEVTAEEMARAEELVLTKFATEEWTARMPSPPRPAGCRAAPGRRVGPCS